MLLGIFFPGYFFAAIHLSCTNIILYTYIGTHLSHINQNVLSHIIMSNVSWSIYCTSIYFTCTTKKSVGYYSSRITMDEIKFISIIYKYSSFPIFGIILLLLSSSLLSCNICYHGARDHYYHGHLAMRTAVHWCYSDSWPPSRRRRRQRRQVDNVNTADYSDYIRFFSLLSLLSSSTAVAVVSERRPNNSRRDDRSAKASDSLWPSRWFCWSPTSCERWVCWTTFASETVPRQWVGCVDGRHCRLLTGLPRPIGGRRSPTTAERLSERFVHGVGKGWVAQVWR